MGRCNPFQRARDCKSTPEGEISSSIFFNVTPLNKSRFSPVMSITCDSDSNNRLGLAKNVTQLKGCSHFVERHGLGPVHSNMIETGQNRSRGSHQHFSQII